LTSQRYAINVLIIERLRKRPVPQTIASVKERGDGLSLVTASKASTAAFNVPELLESIFSNLPMEDLFVSSRVNKAFHRLIAASPKLQRKMFMLPGKDQPQKWQAVRNYVNDHVYAMVAACAFDNDYSALLWPDYVFEAPKIVAHLNPLLKSKQHEISFIADPLLPVPQWDSVYSARLNRRILESKSWPQMYLTDPPCTCAIVDVEFAEHRPTSGLALRVRRCVRDPAGVTFGALYDALHAKGFVAIYEGREFWYREELNLVPDTTVSEQLQKLKRKGFELEIDRDRTAVELCHLSLPSDGEFDEMRRSNRVEGAPCTPSSGIVW